MVSRLFLFLAALLFAAPAFAQQSLLQSGPTTAGHMPMYLSNGSYNPIVTDSGQAGGGAPGVGLSELNITARCTFGILCTNDGSGPNGEHMCVQDAPTTSSVGYHSLCIDANINGQGYISYQALGGAMQQPFTIYVNGQAFSFPGTGTCSSCGTMAAQNSSSVSITGGSITGTTVNPLGGSGIVLLYSTLGSTITAPIGFNVGVVVNEPSSPVTVVLPARSNFSSCPSATRSNCPVYIVKDGGGGASSHNITVDASDGTTIDGSSTYVINTNYEAIEFVFNGTQWNVF